MDTPKNVFVYSTPTCPFCRQAKDYLQQKGVQFIDRNVANDMQAREEMKQKSNSLGVPVIDVGGTIIVGFNRAKLDEALGL